MTERPLLVLIHGTRFDAREWSGYADLVPAAEVVAVDLPGHGSRAGSPYSTAAALDVVGAAIEDRTADAAGRPVVLGGHSLGGYVAAAYAQAQPERLAGLVLIGATAEAARHPRLTGLYTGFARALPVVGADRMAGFANGVLRRLGLPPEDIPDATGYAVTPAAWAAVVAEGCAAQLAEVACPVYLVAGQFDQLRLDLRHYEWACRWPRVRILRGATHLAPLTHRAQVAAVFREALAEARLR